MAVFLVNQCIFSKLPNANNDPNQQQQHHHHQTNGAGSSQSNQSSSNDSNSNLSAANLAPAGQQATPSNICGQKFDSLFELIHHIEDNHIDDVDYAPIPGAGLYYNGAQAAAAAGHLQPHHHNYVQYDRHHVNQIINGGWLPTSCILRIFNSTHKTKKQQQPQQLQPIPQVMQHQHQPQPLAQTMQHQTIAQHPIQQQYQMQLAQQQQQPLQPAGVPQAPPPTIAGLQAYPAAMQQLQVSTVRTPPNAATVYQAQPQQPQIITVPQNIVLSPQAPPMQTQPNLGPQAQPQLAPPQQQQPQIITVPQAIVQQQQQPPQPPQQQMALPPQVQAQQTLQAQTQQTQPTPPPPQVQQQPQIITIAQSPAQLQTDNLPLAKPAKYKCSDCNRTYKTVRGLRTHQTTQHQKPPATPQDSKPPVAVVESGETTSSSCPPDIASQTTSKSPSF